MIAIPGPLLVSGNLVHDILVSPASEIRFGGTVWIDIAAGESKPAHQDVVFPRDSRPNPHHPASETCFGGPIWLDIAAGESKTAEQDVMIFKRSRSSE